MIILNCEDIEFSYGANIILDGISLRLDDKDKVGLVGVNGAGKSTLFRIITGELLPDNGSINIPKTVKLGKLEQDTGLNPDATLISTVLESFSYLIEMEDRLKKLELKISKSANNAGAESHDKLLTQYAKLTDDFEKEGGYLYRSKSKGVLNGLGFDDSDFERKTATLSGGQKTRLALGRLLLTEPDILMLDEPTNHLDIQAIQWMETYLSSYPKCVFVISHDRYFLDKVINKTIELENTHCYVYNTSYSGFIKQKADNREILMRQYENQQKEIKRMEDMIQQLKQWNREKSIKQAESKQKALDRMDKLERPGRQPSKIRLRFRSGITSGKDVLFVENLTKAFGSLRLFNDLSFQIHSNEKAFLLGPNGCGKSTLLKILEGRIGSDNGTVEYGHHIDLGYYDQELSGLDMTKTVLEEVWDDNGHCNETTVRNTLAAFGFYEEDVLKTVQVLSGGEKSRVLLAKLMLSNHNFLILDEPTNHLDINSREALEKALKDYDGTVLCVSHDRYFINKLATRVMEINPRFDKEPAPKAYNMASFLDINGDYDFFIQYKQRLEREMAENAQGGGDDTSQGKKDYLSRKQSIAEKRKREKQLQETEENIHQTESRINELLELMASTEVATDHQKLQQIHSEQQQLEKNLETLYEEWEKIVEFTNDD